MRTPATGRSGDALAPRIGLVDLGEVEIAFSERTSPPESASAPDAAADFPVLVLLHGLTGHRDDFQPLLAPLAARLPGFRILAPDLRGHGDSTHAATSDGYTFARLVDDLNVFLDRLDVGRCHLLGHSFGGMVSLRFALARPERLRSLVLASTAPFAPAAFTQETFEKAGAIARTRGMPALQTLVERRARAAAPVDPADRQALRWGDAYWAHHRHRYRAMDPLAYHELGLAMVRQEDLSPRLAALAMPVTAIVGRDDTAFLAGADALARSIPGVVRVDIPDAGHHPHRENPPAWLDALVAHLDRAKA